MQVNTQATEVALKAASNEVSNFVISASKEVAALEARFGNVVPIATTKEGYQQCKDARKELMPIKKGLEEARSTLKAPILEAGRLVDSTMKPLAERVGLLITPFENAYREVDQQIERKKQARLHSISHAFQAFDNALLSAIGKSSDEIQESIDELADLSLDPKIFMERTDEAVVKFSSTMDNLGSLLMQAINSEEIAVKQKAFDEREAKILADEAREQARVDKIAADAEQVKQNVINARLKAELDAEMDRAREEARKQALIDAQFAHEKALADAELRAKEQAEDATRAERARIEAKQAQEQAEADDRENNRKHKAAIHNEILTAFLTTGITEIQGKALIKLIATRKINPIRISY